MLSSLKARQYGRGSNNRPLRGFHLQGLLEKIDIFGAPLPAFNIKGTTVVHTVSGGLTTFLIIVVMLAYASIKTIQLFSKHHNNVVQITEKNFFDYHDRLDLNEIGFRLAFSVEGYHSRERKDDPRYVKYFVRIFGVNQDREYEKVLGFHECTRADWE